MAIFHDVCDSAVGKGCGYMSDDAIAILPNNDFAPAEAAALIFGDAAGAANDLPAIVADMLAGVEQD